MIAESQWINLPVGENLMDHPNVCLCLIPVNAANKCRPRLSCNTPTSSSTTSTAPGTTLSRPTCRATYVWSSMDMNM